jgi:hypothetical protein
MPLDMLSVLQKVSAETDTEVFPVKVPALLNG